MLNTKTLARALHLGILSLLLFIFLFPGMVSADWQETLEQHFDIVSTFDELQPWHGTRAGGNVTTEINHPEDLPQLKTGGKGIWGIYSQYYSGPNQAIEDWIGPHGGKAWSGTQCAAINYKVDVYCSNNNNSDNYKGYGPGRLGLYIGDGTPTSGYSDVHVFFMMYIPPGFFIKNQDGTYQYAPVVKFFDAVTGFNDVYNYSIPDTCQPNIQYEYGTNFYVFNISGGGSRPNEIYPVVAGSYSLYDDSQSCWKYEHNDDFNYDMRGAPIVDPINNGQWFGVEYEYKTGDPDVANGSMRIWVYDHNGNLLGTDGKENVLLQKHFNHKINKFVWGGNYQCTNDTDSPGEKTWWLFDDVIIDDQPIAQTYFSLLNSSISFRADVDNNSQINSTDAMLTLRNSVNLDMSGTDWQASNTTGDADCDGDADSTDAMLILRDSLGLDMSVTGWCIN